MNDEVKDYIETINNKKVRTQHKTGAENGQSEDTEYPCNSARPIQLNPSTETACSSSCTMLNGAGINNLNNRSYSNGYNNVQLQENIDSYKPRNGQCEKDLDKMRKSSLYRNIYNSSSSEDDDEHCVYTYKGAEVGSDLPESFFNLGVNVQNNRDRASRCSSPEMDFLEMDFDPGPSNGQDSDSDNASLHQNFSSNEHINEMYTDLRECGKMDNIENKNLYLAICDENANCYSNKMPVSVDVIPACAKSNSAGSFSEQSPVDYEKPCCSKSLNSSGCDDDKTKFIIKPFRIPERNLSADSSDEEGPRSEQSQLYANLSVRKCSLDSDREAFTFIPDGYQKVENEDQNESTSSFDISVFDTIVSEDDLISYEDLLPLDPSYSISAIINVAKMLRTSQSCESDREKLTNLLRPKQIPENVPLVEYLFMRAVQNANEIDLAHFSATVFRNQMYSRFFSTYPQTQFNLLEWLNSWMRKGAIPVVTRNIQERGTLAAKNIIQNPWRHNVVYKLEAPYVHLSNPSERVLDRLLHSQLSQPPLIYVKRKYVLEKWHSKVDLRSLTRANHNRWYNENVLGQVATIIREDNCGSQTTQYVRVPSNCRCGITLFVPSGNVGLCKEVDEALELPVSCY